MSTRPRERFRSAEAQLFRRYAIDPEEIWIDVADPPVRVRALVIGHGPPIVLANGIASPGVGFVPLLPELDGYRLIVLDLPGHGLSPAHEWQDGSLRTQAVAILSAVLDQLMVDRSAVIANSMGGLFALWLALDAPDRVSALVLLGEPATALPGARGIPMMGMLSLPIVGKVFEWSMRLPAPRWLVNRTASSAMGRAAVRDNPEVIAAHGLALRVPGQARSFRSLLRRLLDGRTPRPENVLTDEELARLTLPVLFVWGTHDPFLSCAAGRASVAKITGAVLEEHPAGHDPWLDDPVACGRSIREFLSSCAMTPAPSAR